VPRLAAAIGIGGGEERDDARPLLDLGSSGCARPKSAGRSESAEAMVRAVATMDASCWLRRNVSIAMMNCAARNGSTSSASAATPS
jgi:hypothetical protein